MPMSKWFVIARNEYRITTSRMGKIRPYFLYLVIGLLAVYVAYIAPKIVNFFLDDLLAFFLSQAAVAMVQILLFMFFFYFLLIPISSTLKDVEIGHMEIFLSAPIKSSDVLLGTFLGQVPFYAILITVITGFFTAIMAPLGLNMIQIAIIVIIFVVTLLSGQWIGTVIAALLGTKLGKIARGKDIGKALGFIIALPMVAIMYAIIGGGLLKALADPGTSGMVKIILGWLPSSWGADIITSFASNPGVIGFGTLIRFGGLIIFFVAALWLGTKVADRAYSMEQVSFTASRVKPDGAFYKTIKYIGGGRSFGTLLVSIFKDYSRRLQNISYIVYVVGLLVLINVFLLKPEESGASIEMSMFMFPMLAAFVASDVTVRGKETLFIYRKTPSGVGKLIRVMLFKDWLVVVPIAATIMAISTILSPQTTFISLLTNVGFVIVYVPANVVFALGLFLVIPAYSEKGGALMINLMIVVMFSIGLFEVSRIVFGKSMAVVGAIVLNWLVGIVVLSLGKRHLNRME